MFDPPNERSIGYRPLKSHVVTRVPSHSATPPIPWLMPVPPMIPLHRVPMPGVQVPDGRSGQAHVLHVAWAIRNRTMRNPPAVRSWPALSLAGWRRVTNFTRFWIAYIEKISVSWPTY